MRYLLLVFLMILLVACEAEATPIAFLPTAPSDENIAAPISTNVPNLRYGLFVESASYVRDFAQLDTLASLEIISDANNLPDYDIVAAYGRLEGWQVSPITQHIALALNPNLSPLDNEIIRNLIPLAIDSRHIIEALALNGMQPNALEIPPNAAIRTSFANQGYPDGFQLTVATEDFLGLDAILMQLTQRNIRIQRIDLHADSLAQNQAHLFLFVWSNELTRTEWTAQVGEANVIDLYTLPISYLAKEGLQIEFSENGFPLPAR